MGLLKRIFGSDKKPVNRDESDSNAIILYVKVKKCGAIARVRVDLRNDLSLDEDGEAYIVRKSIVDNVCYGTSELELRFDSNHRELSRAVTNGEIVARTEWEQQEALRIGPRTRAS